MVVTTPLIDGVDDEGDEPRVGAARVPFWAGAQVNPNQTGVPVSPRQPARYYSRLEGLSTSGVYELCLDSSLGHPFLDTGCRYLSSPSCTGFEQDLKALLGYKKMARLAKKHVKTFYRHSK